MKTTKIITSTKELKPTVYNRIIWITSEAVNEKCCKLRARNLKVYWPCSMYQLFMAKSNLRSEYESLQL